MTDSQPKFKFKKRSKTSKKNLRKTDDDTKNNVGEGTNSKIEDDNNGAPSSVEEEEDEGPSALNTILAVERRRKLLDKRNRGVDTATLGKQTTKQAFSTNNTESETTTTPITNTQNKDFDQRLQMSFAGGKLAGSNDMGGDDEGGILAKKHKLAMEDYIKQNLNAKDGGVGTTINNNNGEENGNGTNNATTEAEKELYAELLVKDETNTNGVANKEGEGDVGAGGAMMGGTGIAEVALPIDERIKALKETERVAMEIERARKARFGGMGEVGPRETFSNDGNSTSGQQQNNMNSSTLSAMVPMNFASGPGKRKRQEDVGLIGVVAESSSQQQSTNKSQTTTNIGPAYNVESSAIPATSGYSASSAGSHVQKSDVSTLGASYSHNFQLHTKEWVSRKRDERQSEIEAVQAQQMIDEGPTTAENEKRVGFEQSRKIAKGEVVAPATVSGGTAGGGRNEWDRKQGGGNQPSSDERVWRNFMSKQRNRR